MLSKSSSRDALACLMNVWFKHSVAEYLLTHRPPQARVESCETMRVLPRATQAARSYLEETSFTKQWFTNDSNDDEKDTDDFCTTHGTRHESTARQRCGEDERDDERDTGTAAQRTG